MKKLALGIDLGTSYTKVALRRPDGLVVDTYTIPSPKYDPTESSKGIVDAVTAWRSVVNLVACSLQQATDPEFEISAICVSGIAPSIVIVDQVNRGVGLLLPYHLLCFEYFSSTDNPGAGDALSVLKENAKSHGFVEPGFTDLVGYVNWCLTGKVSLNSMSARDITSVFNREIQEICSLIDAEMPNLVAPVDSIGRTDTWASSQLGYGNSIPVCGGSTDTLASIVGAGLEGPGESMIYLGSFGSLLTLDSGVSHLLSDKSGIGHAYTWQLSVPGFGRRLESDAQRWFNCNKSSSCLTQLDSLASQCSEGAEGTLFLVPRWRKYGEVVGSYRLLPGADDTFGGLERKSRSILESLGYAISLVRENHPEPIRVSGGGCRSQVWIDALSFIIGTPLIVKDMAWAAAGTVDIAARMAWRENSIDRDEFCSSAVINRDHPQVRENFQRISEEYKSNGWI